MVNYLKNIVTIYQGILGKMPYNISIGTALERIKTGASAKAINELRGTLDLKQAKAIKNNLPAVCFSGKFDERKDEKIIKHSGLIILDFDKLENIEQEKEILINNKYIFAYWISPSGNGLKTLIKIKDTSKHREHYKALCNEFPKADKQNINLSRLTFESYDKNLFLNENSEIYTKIEEEKILSTINIQNSNDYINNILKWLSNKGDTFVSGERNFFIYKLASACCRFGIDKFECENFCIYNYGNSDFSKSEIINTIKSAYKGNTFATAIFIKNNLVEKINRQEVDINTDKINSDIKPKDIIFGADVKSDIIKLYDKGYETIKSTGIFELDEYFKFKKGEITLLSGYGNYGKTTYIKFLCLLQAIIYDKKVCMFSPEDLAHEFYHDLIEMYIGECCLPSNYERQSKDIYLSAYEFISKHFFYVYPKNANSSPEYINEIFLEMIIKHKVEGCIIDPFNQLDNDYNSAQNTSKYLEKILNIFSRFAMINNIYFIINHHPKSPKGKEKDGNYACPDVFDLNDGAMWNNKMDNILIFHKPFMQTEPDNSICEHHSKKIRRQKIVGKRGWFNFEYNRKKRRFIFDGKDYIDMYLNKKIEPERLYPIYKEESEQLINFTQDCPF